jgi:hypothetical protein
MPLIIFPLTDNHWSAYFADSPEPAFGGEWPTDMIKRRPEEFERSCYARGREPI